MEKKLKTFDEAYEEVLQLTPSELEDVEIDPFIQEAFDAFNAMQECNLMLEDDRCSITVVEQD